MLSLSRVAASSRLIAYNSAVRRSRAPATRVCWRTRATSVAITSATISMTANVNRYWTSETANVNRGGTKKKSKQSTFSTAVSTDGQTADPQSRDHDAEQIHHHEIRQLEVREHAEGDDRAGGRDREQPRDSASSAWAARTAARARRPATARRRRAGRRDRDDVEPLGAEQQRQSPSSAASQGAPATPLRRADDDASGLAGLRILE